MGGPSSCGKNIGIVDGFNYLERKEEGEREGGSCNDFRLI